MTNSLIFEKKMARAEAGKCPNCGYGKDPKTSRCSCAVPKGYWKQRWRLFGTSRLGRSRMVASDSPPVGIKRFKRRPKV